MPATIAVTIQDGKNPPKSSTVFVNISPLTAIANAAAYAGSIASLIDAVIGGKITHIAVCYQVALPGGLKAIAQATADVEEGAKFLFRTVQNHLTGFRLPTFLESLILPGTKSVNLADTAVDALIDAVTAGVLGTEATDSRDEDIVSIESAKENFVKDRG